MMDNAVTVLVVDDDVLIAMTCVDMVSDLGYRALEANSGAQALEVIAQEGKIDLLITDYSMPGMNGVDLARAARTAVPQIAIVVATGYAEVPGDPDFPLTRIAKPYSQADLAAGIEKALAGRSS